MIRLKRPILKCDLTRHDHHKLGSFGDPSQD